MANPTTARLALFDEIEESRRYAETHAHILGDLVCADDDVSDSDPNDPASRTQRMHASIEALKMHLIRIKQAQKQVFEIVVAVDEVAHG